MLNDVQDEETTSLKNSWRPELPFIFEVFCASHFNFISLSVVDETLNIKFHVLRRLRKIRIDWSRNMAEVLEHDLGACGVELYPKLLFYLKDQNCTESQKS